VVYLLGQGAIKIFTASVGAVIQDRRGYALRCRKCQAPCIGFVADNGGDANAQSLRPAALLRGPHDSSHIGATTRNQNHDVFHTACIIAFALGAFALISIGVLGILD
jgi:hypothetical protein